MLNENKDIDQLFRENLGDFEKTPPSFLWNKIQARLDEKQNGLRFTMVKTVGIAAAILLAFLAGWWMTNPTDKAIPQNNVAIQNTINSGADTSANKTTDTVEMLSVNANPVAQVNSKNSQKVDETQSRA